MASAAYLHVVHVLEGALQLPGAAGGGDEGVPEEGVRLQAGVAHLGQNALRALQQHQLQPSVAGGRLQDLPAAR